MAYFLKKSNNNKGTYLQIYESFYDPKRKATAHRSIKPIGYVHELEEQGIDNPIEYYKAEIKKMNETRKEDKKKDKVRKIAKESPERLIGYAPFKAVNETLDVHQDMAYLQLAGGFHFSLDELLSSLVYARLVCPCSKSKTFHEVLPRLGMPINFSLDQLYDGLAFLGQEYLKVIEIYNHHIERFFKRNTDTLYFDATNFYFEIDAEDTLRRKGPSKEHRNDPIVGLGLLLDGDLLPIGMKIFPGNESEKPVVREVIDDIKQRTQVGGRTIRVADKGLNCADNIAHAILDGDGYIFSKSVKQLPKIEQDWVLDSKDWQDVYTSEGVLAYKVKSCVADFDYQVSAENGKKKPVSLSEKRVATFNPSLCKKQKAEIRRLVEKAKRLRLAQAKKSEYGECSKFVSFSATTKEGEESEDKVCASLNHNAINKAYDLAGYNLLVTSETNASESEIYSAYHQLWRIEESFRVMKSELEARPVYLQKQDTITGHFLICYLAVTLLRLLQMKVLDKNYSSESIMNFARNFRVVEASERRYVNISRSTEVLEELERKMNVPLSNYHLTKGQVSKILEVKLPLS